MEPRDHELEHQENARAQLRLSATSSRIA
jgi:hypothetical protein